MFRILRRDIRPLAGRRVLLLRVEAVERKRERKRLVRGRRRDLNPRLRDMRGIVEWWIERIRKWGIPLCKVYITVKRGGGGTATYIAEVSLLIKESRQS